MLNWPYEKAYNHHNSHTHVKEHGVFGYSFICFSVIAHFFFGLNAILQQCLHLFHLLLFQFAFRDKLNGILAVQVATGNVVESFIQYPFGLFLCSIAIVSSQGKDVQLKFHIFTKPHICWKNMKTNTGSRLFLAVIFHGRCRFTKTLIMYATYLPIQCSLQVAGKVMKK